MLTLLVLAACDGADPVTEDTAALVDSQPQVDCDCAVEDLQTFYLDADGDGYGDPDQPVEACEQPDYAVTNADDCDDLDPDVWDTATWFADSDGDGFGDAGATVDACDAPSGHVADDTDCDDGDASVFPGSDALDDPDAGLDADCDGTIACSDADCDGEIDLVYSVYFTSDGGYCGPDLVYLGDGSDFSAVTPAELATECTWHHAVRDLDQDGFVDLVSVVTTDDSTPRETDSHVFWGSSSGWSDGDRTDLPTVGPVGVLVEDLDQDGWDDLFFAEASSHGNAGFEQQSTIHWGSASGFASTTDLTTYGAWESAAADLDGDGHLDLVVCNYYDDSSAGLAYEVPSFVFWGSSGGFSDADRTDLPTAGCRGVEIVDLDQDGLDDLVFANSQDNTWDWQIDSVVYWNSATGFSTSSTTALPTSWSHGVTTGDFDGDGWTDVAFGSFYGDAGYDHPAYVYWNDAGWLDADDVTELDGHASYGLAAADLDGDGDDELVVPGAWSDEGGQDTTSRVYWGSRQGLCLSDALSTHAPGEVNVADLDGDGWPELLFPAPYGGEDAQIFWGSDEGYSDEDSSSFGQGVGGWAAPLPVGDHAG